MKAEELRIGNLVNHFDQIIGVDGIDDLDVFNKDCGEIPLHSIQPIPLTEEWLLKFGFEVKPISKWNGNDADYRPENVSTEQRDFVLDSFILRYEIFTFNNVSEITTYCGINSSWYPKVYFDSVPLYRLKYIHQLQNLYFALTGEELTIKSK